MLNEKLRQDDLVCPQRVVPILPVKHQVVLIIRICGKRERAERCSVSWKTEKTQMLVGFSDSHLSFTCLCCCMWTRWKSLYTSINHGIERTDGWSDSLWLWHHNILFCWESLRPKHSCRQSTALRKTTHEWPEERNKEIKSWPSNSRIPNWWSFGGMRQNKSSPWRPHLPNNRTRRLCNQRLVPNTTGHTQRSRANASRGRRKVWSTVQPGPDLFRYYPQMLDQIGIWGIWKRFWHHEVFVEAPAVAMRGWTYQVAYFPAPFISSQSVAVCARPRKLQHLAFLPTVRPQH